MSLSRITARITATALALTIFISTMSQVPAPSNTTGNDNWDMNWVRVKTYDGNGKVIGESKQFVDNSGNLLQTQNKVKYRKDPSTTFTHVFATQPVRDVLGREVVNTMPAPIDNSEFNYKPDFVRNGGGTAYDYHNFDRSGPLNAETDKTNNPDPIGVQNVQGTLGWYYSANNTWEPYTPTTNYPYSRQVYYRDGTGNIKKGAGAGEVFKSGNGHEASGYITPVVNELDHYIQVRNRFFPATEVGATPATLQSEAIQSISSDANGRMGIVISDKGGHTLMAARPGSDLTVSNTATVAAGNVFYFRTFTTGNIAVSSGANEFYNMATEQLVNIGTGGSIAQGYYKLVNTGTSDITITYSNSYADVSYSFYNQLGQLIANISPEGVKKLYGSGINTYATKNDVPFITLPEYDVRGRLVKTTSTDDGVIEFVYRKDGKIRFSQNAEQKLTGRYSYTNYDQLGRSIESGEYDGSGIQFNSDLSAPINPMRDILENIGATGGLTTGTKTDVVIMLYDLPDNSHGLSGYTQDELYLGNGISMSRKFSVIVNNAPNSADIVSGTWYNYDEEGKVLWLIQYIKDLGYKTTDYTYDPLGRVIKKAYQKNTASETFVHFYDYDPVTQNIWKIYTDIFDNGSTKQLQATYIYYLHGPLKRIELATDLQGLDYTYTLQGALKAVNNSDKTQDPAADGSNGINADAFGMVLDYFPGDYQNNRTSGIRPIKGVNTSGVGNDSYAGNIKAMTWFSRKPSLVTGSTPGIEDPTTYVYQYDEKYQFTESTWGTGINFGNTPATFTTTSLNKETVKHPVNGTPAYDANGNIMYLQRSNPTGALQDRFTYNYLNSSTGTGSNTSYNTNKLQSVVNDATGTPQTYATYIYDKLGQLTVENSGGATTKYIKYNASGKVVQVARDNLFQNLVVEYVYDELGQRIIKRSYNPSFQLSQITYYTGSVIYTQPVSNNIPGSITAQEYQIRGGNGILGIYYRQIGIYAYQLSDHLGNVRAVVARNGSATEVRTYNDYYPYGGVIRQYRSPEGYRYEFQGQYAEKDKETDWNAFELRMYDSKIARWLQHDPEGEFWSPYVGMGNDPVTKVDPDGGHTEDWYATQNSNGTISLVQDAGRHDATVTFNGQTYVNVGGDHLSAGMADLMATSYFANPALWNAGKNMSHDQGTIRPYVSSYWQSLEKGALLSKIGYNIADAFYVTGQNLGGKQVMGRTYALHLNGSMTTPKENVQAFTDAGTSFLPMPKVGMVRVLAPGTVTAGFSGVYVLEYISKAGIKAEYVGKSIDVLRRMGQHMRRLGKQGATNLTIKETYNLGGYADDALRQFEQFIIDGKGGIGNLHNSRNAYLWP